MKAKILSFLMLCSTFIFAQIVNIPDANFKAKLLQASPTNKIAKDLTGNYFKIDANGNGEIEVSEAEKVTYLYVIDSSISSLEGILSFKNLQTLYCSENKLTSLNVQGFMVTY
jgi:Leucine-rich repeat (LRR) protein